MNPAGDGHALIVEDDLLSSVGIRHILEDLGYSSFSYASNERQAVDQCRVNRPDLVTLDLQLSEGDGQQAARRILETCGFIPLVFITGSPQRVSGRWATVVEKPVSGASLARAIQIARDRVG